MTSYHLKWKEYGWWWCDPNKFAYDPGSHLVQPIKQEDLLEWRISTERVAWTYELVRLFDFHPKSIPYPQLDYWTHVALETDLLNSGLVWMQVSAIKIWQIGKRAVGPEWMSCDGLRWNLKASDNSLIKHFQSQVHYARKRQGITPPRKNAGKKTRPVSWLWPEVLDLTRRGEPTEEDVTLWKAQQRAKEAKNYVSHALARVELWRRKEGIRFRRKKPLNPG